jgi:phosphoserine phosphatase RsbU/P
VAMLPEAAYEQSSVVLRAGDLLVVVSDGIVKARNKDGEFWEEEEVERVVVRHRGGGMGKQSDALCRAVDDFAVGAEQYDDMTIVAVRIL